MRLFEKVGQRLTLPGFTLVPSALVVLTALFGMGRGGPHRHSRLKIFHCDAFDFNDCYDAIMIACTQFVKERLICMDHVHHINHTHQWSNIVDTPEK